MIESEPKGMNAQEEKELRRVFDHVANFRAKNKLASVLQEKNERKLQLEISRKNPKGVPTIDAKGNRMTEEEIRDEIQRVGDDIEKKKAELSAVNNHPHKAIRHEDLADAIKVQYCSIGSDTQALGKSCTKKEIHDMIWEADENLDNSVDWEELKAMFNRNLKDKTGLEPVNLFNVIQFMTYDKKLCGTITADDTMAILFARYGRAQLEPRMRQLFGDSEELKFTDYLERVNTRSKKSKR